LSDVAKDFSLDGLEMDSWVKWFCMMVTERLTPTKNFSLIISAGAETSLK